VRIAAGRHDRHWLFGEITISINVGARIQVEGPDVPRRRDLRDRVRSS
jgi:hypothetical protein